MKRLSLLFCLIILLVSAYGQTTYYVEKTGLDSKQCTGLSADDAWATPGYALQNAENGSVIRIGEGTFHTANTYVLRSKQEITFEGVDRNKTVLTVDEGKRLFDSTASSLTLRKLKITGVQSPATSGGAIISKSTADGDGILVCDEVDFIDNVAQNGAAVYALGGTVNLTRCNFIANRSEHTTLAYGCLNVLSNNGYALNLYVSQCLFSENVAKNHGSALRIYLKDDAQVLIQNNTFHANFLDAAYNGTIAIEGPVTENIRDVKIINNTVAGNLNSSGQTAGIYLAVPHVVSLYNNIITGNTRNAIQLSMAATYLNTILNNVIDNGIAYGTSSNAVLLEDLSEGISYMDVCDNNIDGMCEDNIENVSADDLKLQPLSDNGGFTKTMALAEGSVAIDNGVSDIGIETDQRGMLRDLKTDIGAYEYGGMNTGLAFGEYSMKKLDVYPNPFTDFIRIKAAHPVRSVEIYAINGRKLAAYLKDIPDEINTSGFPAGNYLVLVTDTEENKETIVIIKK